MQKISSTENYTAERLKFISFLFARRRTKEWIHYLSSTVLRFPNGTVNIIKQFRSQPKINEEIDESKDIHTS